MSFLILSLPRSRSAWLAHYLSYLPAPQPVGHEVLTNCPDVDTFLKAYDEGMLGTVETAGAMLWGIVRQELPDCRIVLVRRPLLEVHRSLTAKGLVVDLGALAEVDAILDMASCDPAIVSLPFPALRDPMVGRWLFETLLERPWDEEWWQAMSVLNVQVDMPRWQLQLNDRRDLMKSLIADVTSRYKEYESDPRRLN